MALPFAYSSSSLFVPRYFFFNATSTSEIYTLSLHDALPISVLPALQALPNPWPATASSVTAVNLTGAGQGFRSEEHTSELQSLRHLVCRLLLEKKKKRKN